MNAEDIKRLFSEDEFDGGIDRNWTGDNAVQGILIIMKYIDHMKTDIICGAGHDELFSVDIDGLVEKNITEADVKELVRLNWLVSEGYLSCFV